MNKSIYDNQYKLENKLKYINNFIKLIQALITIIFEF